MNNKNILDSVSVIMVGTTHPGNLGATARSMGTMGIQRLLLARPESDPLDNVAVSRAAGHAQILVRSEKYIDLKAALTNISRAYAFTARARNMPAKPSTPKEATALVMKDLAIGNQVALVFGPERSGLDNDETDMCDVHVEIPSSDKGSLNIASAVQIACYEMRCALALDIELPVGDDSDLATKGDILNFLDHAAKVITDYYPIKHPGMYEKMMRRLTLLINRASPADADVRMLRGFLREVQRQDKQNDSDLDSSK